jgi:hypothetical protein
MYPSELCGCEDPELVLAEALVAEPGVERDDLRLGAPRLLDFGLLSARGH